MSQKVKRVIELMHGDPSQALCLEKMAQSVNLSATHFCYLFKSVTGTPPAKYLKSLRMRHAATLLTSTFLSVKEIVFRAGFSDESHFVRDFKKIYGVTPSEYRNRALLIGSEENGSNDSENRPTNRKNGQ